MTYPLRFFQAFHTSACLLSEASFEQASKPDLLKPQPGVYNVVIAGVSFELSALCLLLLLGLQLLLLLLYRLRHELQHTEDSDL